MDRSKFMKLLQKQVLSEPKNLDGKTKYIFLVMDPYGTVTCEYGIPSEPSMFTGDRDSSCTYVLRTLV